MATADPQQARPPARRYAATEGGLPAPADAAACQKVLEMATKLAADAGVEVEFTPRLLANLASGSRGELAPLTAFFGGVVGQEVGGRRHRTPTPCTRPKNPGVGEIGGIGGRRCAGGGARAAGSRALPAGRARAVAGDEGGVGQVPPAAAVALL